MDFAFSEEQEAFRETLRRFFEERCPAAELLRLAGTQTGYDAALWKQLAGELYLPGIAIPEEYGGQGFGFLELGIALEESGRVLLPAPLFASACLAASAILAAGTPEQKRALLPGIASGETLASLALVEPDGDWDPASVRMTAQRAGSHFVLGGEKRFVVDGEQARLVVVVARLAGALELFALRTDQPGVRAEPLPTLDLTRRQARLVLEGARAELLGGPGAGRAALAETLAHAAVGLAAEMAGGAARCLDMAVTYAKERRQFARPIGSFQAVQHKAAEVLLEVESARSAAWWACWAAAERAPERAQAAHLAKAFCGDAYLRAAAENIQIHGGIGFTWEAAPHLYYRRAKVSETLFGDSVHHRACLAGALGLGA